jgi:hypothetical protein
VAGVLSTIGTKLEGFLMSTKPIKEMTTEELWLELGRLCADWDALRADPDLAGGGSPGEWMIERMGGNRNRAGKARRTREFCAPEGDDGWMTLSANFVEMLIAWGV